jgi:hypothetical protein
MDQRKVFLMPRVAETDFATLRALMRNQPDFPPTYDRWHVFWAGRQQQEEAKGFRPAYIDVNVTHFQIFLAARKTAGTWSGLAAFMAAITHR